MPMTTYSTFSSNLTKPSTKRPTPQPRKFTYPPALQLTLSIVQSTADLLPRFCQGTAKLLLIVTDRLATVVSKLDVTSNIVPVKLLIEAVRCNGAASVTQLNILLAAEWSVLAAPSKLFVNKPMWTLRRLSLVVKPCASLTNVDPVAAQLQQAIIGPQIRPAETPTTPFTPRAPTRGSIVRMAPIVFPMTLLTRREKRVYPMALTSAQLVSGPNRQSGKVPPIITLTCLQCVMIVPVSVRIRLSLAIPVRQVNVRLLVVMTLVMIVLVVLPSPRQPI